MFVQDSEYIIIRSTIDEQFAYLDGVLSQEYHHGSYFSHEEPSQEIESSDDTKQYINLFEEPSYYRPQEPTHQQQAKEQAKNHQESSLENTSRIMPQKPNAPQVSQALEANEIEEESNSQESPRDESYLQRNRAQRRNQRAARNKKAKKEQYPTKNFLPSFRTSFLLYLSKHFPKEIFQSFQIVRRIRGKPCINLKDYEDLFHQREFRPILAVYFKNQVIVRDLMQSRIEYETKCEYFKRIHVFEDAFISGVFNKINY